MSHRLPRRGTPLTRREMLRNTAWAGFGIWTVSAAAVRGQNRSPNEKLNIAGIGVGGQGAWNIGNCAGENVVALCDVDERRAKGSFEKFPNAKKYRDFRKLFDEMGQLPRGGPIHPQVLSRGLEAVKVEHEHQHGSK